MPRPSAHVLVAAHAEPVQAQYNPQMRESNPHPGDFVTWGDRAADEMGHMGAGSGGR